MNCENLLRISNNYSCFVGDKEVMSKLYNALRFKDRKCFNSPAYQNGVWDGFLNYYNISTGRFLTGLLAEVKAGLNKLGVKYYIQDEREDFKFTVNEIDKHWLPGFTLFDYQVSLTNSILKNHRGIVKIPTGGGKSNILISLLKAVPEESNVLILVGAKQLVEQNYKNIIKAGITDVGRFHSTKKEEARIIVATYQSCCHLKDFMKNVKVLFVDEIHLMTSVKAKAVYRQLTNAVVRVGFSATPFKFGGKCAKSKWDAKGYMGPLLKVEGYEDGDVKVKDLEEVNILSKANCTFFNIDKPQIPFAIYIDAVTKGIAENFYLHDVVKRLTDTLSGRTLILVERITHGETLAKLIPNSFWIQGKSKMNERNVVIEKLITSKKDIVAIATTQIMGVGVDFKIHNLINISDVSNEHQFYQKLGRGLRVADDKDVLFYYDFNFTTNQYLEDHSKNRIKLLKKIGKDVVIKDIDF